MQQEKELRNRFYEIEMRNVGEICTKVPTQSGADQCKLLIYFYSKRNGNASCKLNSYKTWLL